VCAALRRSVKAFLLLSLTSALLLAEYAHLLKSLHALSPQSCKAGVRVMLFVIAQRVRQIVCR
jgi:hypothetical protein